MSMYILDLLLCSGEAVQFSSSMKVILTNTNIFMLYDIYFNII